MKLGSLSSWLKSDLINLILCTGGRIWSMTADGVGGEILGLVYWLLLSLEETLKLD